MLKLRRNNTTLTLIIKTTTDCCLNCSYCYQERIGQQLPLEILEILLTKISKTPYSNIKLIYHGGEPLLRGITFYRLAYEKAKLLLSTKKVAHMIQTNGVLLNSDWADFFQDGGWEVGVSLDASPEIHDCYRKDSSGHGSYQKVVNGLKCLQKKDVRFGVLTVVTEECLGKENFIYDHLKKLGVDAVSFNPLIGKTPSIMHKKGLFQFLSRIYDIWTNDPKPLLSVEPLATIIRKVSRRGNGNLCSFGQCMQKGNNLYFSVVWTGSKLSVYPCDGFFEERFYIGDLLAANDFTDLVRSKKYRIFRQEIRQASKRCRKCFIFEICGSGCRHHAYEYGNDLAGGDPYCASRYLLIYHVKKDLERRGKPTIIKKRKYIQTMTEIGS